MAAHGRFTESAAKQRIVREVQFGVMSPDEIVSVAPLPSLAPLCPARGGVQAGSAKRMCFLFL